MIRPYVRLPIMIGLIVLMCGAMVLGWIVRDRAVGVYTDDDSIRRDASIAQLRDVLWREAEVLNDLINTDQQEYEAKISADGSRLFFVRGKAGENADLYVATRRMDGSWNEPSALASINTEADELGPEPSADGSTLFFYSNRAGGLGGYDIWVSRLDGDEWSTPENLGSSINSTYNDYSPAWLVDGSGLYFSSNRPQDTDTSQPDPEAWTATIREDLFARDYDIYFAAASDHGLGTAAPVEALNSPSNDGAPALSPVGDFLYFASDRTGGRGGFDLYRSRLSQGSHLEVESLGPSVNSPMDELDPALSMGGFALHFSSNRAQAAPAVEGETKAANQFDLYMTTSREVYLDFETRQASIGWGDLLPYILAALLALLALLLLLALLRMLKSDRFGKLSLLARCLLASMLVHLLLLLLLTLWGVGSSFTDWMKDGEGTRVQITSPSVGQGLAAQVRGMLTEIEVTPEAATAEQTEHIIETTLAAAATATFEVQRAVLETVEPIEETPDANDVELERVVEPMEQQQETTPADAMLADVSEELAQPAMAQPMNDAEAAMRTEADVPTDVARAESEPQPTIADAGVTALDVEATNVDDAPSMAEVMNDSSMEESSATLAIDAPDVTAPSVQLPEQVDAAMPLTPQRAAEREVESDSTVRAEVADLPRLAPSSQDAEPDVQIQAVEIAMDADRSAAVDDRSVVENAMNAQDADVESSSGAVALDASELSTEVMTENASIAMADPSMPEMERVRDQEASEATGVIEVAEAQPNERVEVASSDVPMNADGSVEVDPLATDVPLQADSMHEVSASDAAVSNDGAIAVDDTMDIEETLAAQDVAIDVQTESLPTDDRMQQTAEAEMAIDIPDLQSDVERMMADVTLSTEDAASADAVAIEMASEMTLPVDADDPLAMIDAPMDVAVPESSMQDVMDSSIADVAVDLVDVMLPNDADAEPSDDVQMRLVDEQQMDAAMFDDQQAERAEAVTVDASTMEAESSIVEFDPSDQTLMAEASSSMRDAAEPEETQVMPDHAMPDVVVAAPVIDTELMGAIDVDLPDEVEPPADAYARRNPEVRSEVLEEMGGDEQTEEAVELALRWLARQQADDGRWDSDGFDPRTNPGFNATVDVDRAITGLTLLCFLAADHTHLKEGEYQDTVRDGLTWLLGRQSRDGSLMGRESMYSHGIATIALAEAYGMTKDERLRVPVERAVDFILRARNRTVGGWRYAPGQVGDTSVLGWQVMALKSARRAGVDVDEAGFEEANRWLDRVQSERRPGRYAYQLNRAPTHAMTAEAMFVRQLLGTSPREPDMEAGAQYILRNTPNWEERPNTYYWYYATLALMQQQGEAWERWNEVVKDVLVNNQVQTGRHAGSWETRDKWSLTGGRIYQTAICTLTLEVYYRYLPLYLQDELDAAQERGGAE